MQRHGESQIFLTFAQLGGAEPNLFETERTASSSWPQGHAVAGDGRYGRPERTLKHTAVQLPIAFNQPLAPHPCVEGLQPLQAVLEAHQQQVPEAIMERYGPPREPRQVPPVVERVLEPRSAVEVLQQASSKGAVVKGTVSGGLTGLLWPLKVGF